MRRTTLALWAALAVGCGAGATETGAGTMPRVDAYTEEPPEGSARERLAQAVQLLDARQTDAAIAILEALREELPYNGMVLHELGLAYRLAGQPGRAVALLTPYSDALGVTPTAGLGSAADEAGQTAQAETILRRGIARHPRAGLLYSELAVVVGRQGRVEEAVNLFLQGMDAQPEWPTNYLHAANLFSESRAAGMTIYWGEVFRLLEPTSARSEQMASRMIAVLQEHVRVSEPDASGERQIAVSLAPGQAEVSVREGGVMTLPFVHALELGLGTTLAAAVAEGLSLATLHRARARFVSAPHPSTQLFDWLAQLAAANLLEAYDVWLFGPAFPREASAWVQAHPGALEALDTFVRAHPFRPTEAVGPNSPVPVPAPSEPATPTGPVPPESI